jgi:6-phosphogluconolactonase (cycloisomerase 2 family)
MNKLLQIFPFVLLLGTWFGSAPANAQSWLETIQDDAGGVDGLGSVRNAIISAGGQHLYAAGFSDAAIPIFSRSANGALTYLGMAQNGIGGTQGLSGVNDLELSPDGQFLYAAGYYDGTVSVFSRNTATGALTWVQTIGGLPGAVNLALSPDGAHLYLAVFFASELQVYSRNPGTGMLTFLETHSEPGIIDLELSPDGANLYLTAYYSNELHLYDRNTATGALTPAGVIQDGTGGVDGLAGAYYLSVSPDGKHVYVTGYADNAVAGFSRNATTGALTFINAWFDNAGGVDGLQGAVGISTSADGSRVYATGSAENACQVFDRNSTSGTLTPVASLREGAGGVTGMISPLAVTPGASGMNLYISASDGNALVVFGASCNLAVSLPACKTVYKGYAPLACTALNPSVSGGASPYGSLWSTGATSPGINVCPGATTTYSVTVTDANGCTATASTLVEVEDVRCGNNNNKVLVCHIPPSNPSNQHTICVSPNAVPAHLGHGDHLGECSFVPCAGASNLILPPGADDIVFEALPGAFHVDLFWLSNQDGQITRFEVEKSVDGLHFEPVAGQAAKGNDAAWELYQEKDEQPAGGFNFYRLKMNRLDANPTYSATRRVFIEHLPDFALLPNPADEEVLVQLAAFEGKPCSMWICNSLGGVLEKQAFTALPAAPAGFSVASLPEGMYFVFVQVEGRRAVSKRVAVAHGR